MMRRLVCTALLAAVVPVAAQVPATAAPAAPAPAAKSGGPNLAEFRVGGFMVSGERSYDFGGVKTATGQIKGVEVMLRGAGAGLYVRSLSGTFGKQPQVISADVRILLFPPVFTVFGGVGKRALSSTLNTKIYNVIMGGVSSTANIGGSGLRTHISGAFMLAPETSGGKASGVGANQKKATSTGIEGEAAIFYRLPGVPLFFTVGYRTEVFTGKTATTTATTEAPEEVRGIRVGGGIQFGGH